MTIDATDRLRPAFPTEENMRMRSSGSFWNDLIMAALAGALSCPLIDVEMFGPIAESIAWWRWRICAKIEIKKFSEKRRKLASSEA